MVSVPSKVCTVMKSDAGLPTLVAAFVKRLESQKIDKMTLSSKMTLSVKIFSVPCYVFDSANSVDIIILDGQRPVK